MPEFNVDLHWVSDDIAVGYAQAHRLSGKLKGAPDRKRREKGKCERRKSHNDKRPGTGPLAKKLQRTSPKTGKSMSSRRISAVLADAVHFNEHSRPFNQRSITVIIEG